MSEGTHPPAAPTPAPQTVDPRAQAVVNYILENQDKLHYSLDTTMVINFTQGGVKAKITFNCPI